MERFLAFLDLHSSGILLLILILFVVILLINWLAWIFSFGRFKDTDSSRAGVFYVFADFMLKLINDFRHLLALFLVTIFAGALWYGIAISKDQESLSANLQSVMSTLGGLVGSIVGYYFGESAAKRANKEDLKEIAKPLVQESGRSDIKEVEKPAGL